MHGEILMHVCENDYNVQANDLLLADAHPFSSRSHMALPAMLAAWIVHFEPLRRRVTEEVAYFMSPMSLESESNTFYFVTLLS